MTGYASGDMEAFQVLYQRHKPRIFGYLLARLKDRDEAEELFQLVFTKLHVARSSYRQEIPFLPWVFTITRNALIDYVRKRDTYRRHVQTSELPMDSYAAPAVDASGTGIEIEGLASLTETQRLALQLRFEQGLTFAEIAEQIETSALNSRQIISRAIRKLRKLMVGKELHRE